MTPAQLHNATSREAMNSIMTPLINGYATTSEVLVILESVVAGVLTACAATNNHDAAQRDTMLMAIEDGVRRRLAFMPIPKARTP